jgi:hypothetical protein
MDPGKGSDPTPCTKTEELVRTSVGLAVGVAVGDAVGLEVGDCKGMRRQRGSQLAHAPPSGLTGVG